MTADNEALTYAVMSLTNAIQANGSSEDREFDIRKTALLAAAMKVSRETSENGWRSHNQSVIDTAREFEAYLRDGDPEIVEDEEGDDESNELVTCDGHPASEHGEMGVTEYCDGSCKR